MVDWFIILLEIYVAKINVKVSTKDGQPLNIWDLDSWGQFQLETILIESGMHPQMTSNNFWIKSIFMLFFGLAYLWTATIQNPLPLPSPTLVNKSFIFIVYSPQSSHHDFWTKIISQIKNFLLIFYSIEKSWKYVFLRFSLGR